MDVSLTPIDISATTVKSDKMSKVYCGGKKKDGSACQKSKTLSEGQSYYCHYHSDQVPSTTSRSPSSDAPDSTKEQPTSKTTGTRVINVRKANLRRLGYEDLEDWLKKDPENHVYIGRSVGWVEGARKSKWHNPFTAKHSRIKALESSGSLQRESILKCFEEYLRENTELYDQLKELDGKVLGCWCKPESCHGDVIVKLLEEKKE